MKANLIDLIVCTSVSGFLFLLSFIFLIKKTHQTSYRYSSTNTGNMTALRVYELVFTLLTLAVFATMLGVSYIKTIHTLNRSFYISIAITSFLIGITFSLFLYHRDKKLAMWGSTNLQLSPYFTCFMFVVLSTIACVITVMIPQTKDTAMTLQHIMAITVLSFYVGYFIFMVNYSSTKLVVLAVILSIAGAIASLSQISQEEGFFFEVSPQRAACLKRQVSRNHFGENRSCGCCGKGTVGGIPPNYAEWLNVDPDTGDLWHRPDGGVIISDTFSNAEEAKCDTCGPPAYINYI